MGETAAVSVTSASAATKMLAAADTLAAADNPAPEEKPAAAVGEPEDRRFPARPILAASCLVIREDTVLLAQRANPPLVWSAPGGVVEIGERTEAAALRELHEETGVEARSIGLAGVLEFIQWERGGAVAADDADRVLRHYAILCYAARWLAGEPTPGPEAPECRWTRDDEISRLPVTDGLLAIIAAARRLAGA